MIYLYDGTYDGYLSAIFEAFKRHEDPEDITATPPEQLSFFSAPYPVVTSSERARRLERGVLRSIGMEALQYVYASQHSAQPDASRCLLAFLRRGFATGPSILEQIQADDVIRVMRMARHVWHESGRWKEFLRFRELSTGVFIAQYEPENDVTELLMPHFADRFSVQPFLIHDKTRGKAGVYDRGQWMIASSENMVLPDISECEEAYQRLWLLFYDTVAIQARKNPNLRRQMMPKKFWKDMLEMQDRRATSSCILPQERV